MFSTERVLITLVVVCLLLSACGGGAGNPGTTGTDKTWSVIVASITPGSGGNGTAAAEGRNVDIVQNPDCDGDPQTKDPEPFTEHPAVVKVTVTGSNKNETPSDHIIEGYRIDYTVETYGAPPIQSFQSGSQTVVLKPDTETEFQVVLVDIPRKLKLYDDITSGRYSPQYEYLTYTAIYTFYGKDIYGNPFQFVVQTNFDVGNYNYCGGQR